MLNKILSLICSKIVVQGAHKKKMVDYYRNLRIAAENEFTEDNRTTLDVFLRECFEESLKD